MTKSKTHQAVAIGTVLCFTVVSFLSIRERIRNNRTAVLLNAIQAKISTSTQLLATEKAFDINYLREVTREAPQEVLILKHKVAIDYATRIQKSWGSWFIGGDNEAKVYAVFRALKDKVQVSQVAQAYQAQFSENLIDVLRDRFSSSEIKKVMQIVEHLPKYRTKS